MPLDPSTGPLLLLALWLGVNVIVGAIVLCAIACGGGDDSPIAPEPTCNGDGGDGC